MADETADTQPLPPIEESPPWLVNRPELGWDIDGDGKLNSVESKTPEPAVLRGLLVAVVGTVAALVGHALDVSWIDPAIGVYILAAPIGLSLWIRAHVSPAPK